MAECILNCCLYFTANKLAREITKMAEEEFNKIGLSPNYAFLLMISCKSPGICSGDVAKELNLDSSTVTRYVDKLEGKGLVSRESCGKNSLIYPTKEGISTNLKIQEIWDSLYHKYSKVLGYDEGKKLTKIINNAAEKLKKA
ncbi:transcriptional regulator, MarR family [Methanococcus maripaludis C5]|uniref:Transcriptional regulator, MarR family n=1 Tax=Methanococcus maripaludis (strain C5 / ATCC BAA-1333) TaxID=402880 RepID=A4FZ05_METM5|nr:MarR family transcriptional regulator [Methanococcus maripaludis]ABO35439.1 transcriptional regulator, MarR family [Methanococcus maripaludis C5]